MLDLFGLSHQGKTIIDSFYVNNLRVNFHFFDRATFLFFEFFCLLQISGWLYIFIFVKKGRQNSESGAFFPL